MEDPCDHSDTETWKTLKSKIQRLIVSSELGSIKKTSLDFLVVEPWKFGVISKSVEEVRSLTESNVNVIVNSGCGDIDDNFVVDFAVGISALIFKGGAPTKSFKYNRLLRIEEELGEKAVFPTEKLNQIFKKHFPIGEVNLE